MRVAVAEGARFQDLHPRVRLQTAFRILAAVVGLVVTATVQWRGGVDLALGYDFRPLYTLLIFVFATSIPAALGLRLIKQVHPLEWIASAQFLIDIAVITVLVQLTGGIDSVFHFLYLLTIINASAVLFRRGALMAAAAAAVAYGLLVSLSYYGVIEPFAPDLLGGGNVNTREAFYRVGSNTVAFLLTGVLASYLAGILRTTGQELAERSIDLRELQVLTRHIVDNINSGLLTVDRNWRVTSFNRGAEEITGFRFGAVHGAALGDIFPGVADRIGRRIVEARRYEESYVRKEDGVSLTLGFSYSPLRDDDGVEIGTIVIFQDLTELREMETRLKREERLAAVGRLAAGIAHEIRNPLASISGSIEMLRGDRKPGSEDARLMDIILRETDRLDGLISEFLQYVKPVKQRRRKVELESVLRETTDAIAATEAGRRLDVSLPETKMPLVRGDRDQIKQVVWNLLLNASQAMEGHGRIAVTADQTTLGKLGDVLILDVTDEGVGIAAEELPRIFEPFFTTKERGTGLGLATVHKIVEAHGGHIEVESEQGKGTRFRIVLPLWSAEDEERWLREGEPERETSPGMRGRTRPESTNPAQTATGGKSDGG